MKRIIKNHFFLFFFSITLLNSDAFALESLKDYSPLLKKSEVNEFFKVIKKICKRDNFFSNIANHRSYPKYGKKKEWLKVCNKIVKLKKDINYKKFLIKNFQIIKTSSSPGLLTGYYEPTINVSRKKDSIFKYPILKKNKKYFNKPRNFINNSYDFNDVILWTDDDIDLFFLHIQGSGIGKFSSGEKIKIVYNGNNNLSYTSIGKYLIKNNFLKKKEVNLFSIKKWLRENKDRYSNVMNLNKRFIFFKIIQENDSQPVGAFGMKLFPNISIAVDKKIYPLGIPFLMELESEKSVIPVISLDTGSAIIGPNRADIFTGQNKYAEKKAGNLKKKIYLITLIPYSN